MRPKGKPGKTSLLVSIWEGTGDSGVASDGSSGHHSPLFRQMVISLAEVNVIPIVKEVDLPSSNRIPKLSSL